MAALRRPRQVCSSGVFGLENHFERTVKTPRTRKTRPRRSDLLGPGDWPREATRRGTEPLAGAQLLPRPPAERVSGRVRL